MKKCPCNQLEETREMMQGLRENINILSIDLFVHEVKRKRQVIL